MALIHRFYDVQDGAVLVGGKDVREVTQESLGRHIAMVLQEPYLFTGTVMREHPLFLALGHATRRSIEAATGGRRA